MVAEGIAAAAVAQRLPDRGAGYTSATTTLKPIRLHAALNWLMETAADLRPSENLEVTLERYLDRLLEWVGAEQGSIMLRQDNGLSLVAFRGLSDEVQRGMRVGLTEGPAGAALAEGAPRLLHGRQISRRSGARPASSMVIPIRTHEQIVGVLNVGKLAGAEAFSSEDVQILSVVATQLAWVLSNFELMSRMWTLAITDELTGLFNRRYFDVRFREELQRSERYDAPLCLAMMDLDGFKELNRAHGHQAGDQVLADVCALIRRNLRRVDVAARYGGDEIVVILPESGGPSAFNLITRLQRSVSEHLFLGHDGTTVKLSLCAGIAQFPGDAADPDELIQKADSALLGAKAAGSGSVLLAV